MSEVFLKQAEALGDKARLEILHEIKKKGVVSCGDAGCITKLAQPTVSHHIKILIESGLVHSKKVGRHVELTLNKKAFDDFSKSVDKMTL